MLLTSIKILLVTESQEHNMPIYQIAELNIKIEPIFNQTKIRLEPYLTDNNNFDFEICVSHDDISDYKNKCKILCSDESVENTLILSALCNKLLTDYNGLFFHSSSLMLDNQAYVFTAVSGTGKSTHTALWRKHFGNRVTMINDDKPVIRKIDGHFFVYGTPWMGKSDIGNNISAPIKAIYIIKQSKKNCVEKISAGRYFKEILEATLVPSDKENMHKLLDLLDSLFSKVPLFLLHCNMDDDAVLTAYNAVL